MSCVRTTQDGGRRIAEILGTEVMALAVLYDQCPTRHRIRYR
jgi:hypothetical protein